jgi:uncharacterized protein YecE (DUF72 family)
MHRMMADGRAGSSPWPVGGFGLGRRGQNPLPPDPRRARSLLLEEMEERRGRAPILIGTCNWVDHDEFYPDELRGRRQRERLAFYARYFPLVEIDSSFYGIPTPDRVADWVARTPDDFLFNIKAYRSLTGHEREQGRPRLPTDDEERAFLEALVPLRESGKLGAVHYQYPPWVVSGPAGREALLRARDRHPGDVIAVEFRHRSWFEGERLAETEDLLRELDCTLVGVDAPQLGSGTAPPHLAVTSARLVLVRFHGRNYESWYRKVATTGERFDYLYPPAELRQWVPAIQAAADRGVPVHVLMNNNRSNYAVVNGFDMAHLLGIRTPRPPAPILRRMEARDGDLPGWVREAAEPPAPPALEGSRQRAPDPVVAQSEQLHLDV